MDPAHQQSQRENLKHENQINMPTPTRQDVFGVPLEELMGYDGEKGGLPRVVKDSIQFLRDTGKYGYFLSYALSSWFT